MLLPRNNMTYILITYHFRGFFNWRFLIGLIQIDRLTYEIDVWFQEKIVINNALCLILSPASRA
jgi:hypothetical protein